MPTLAVIESSVAGAVFATANADVGGDEFTNTGREIIYVANGSGGDITVTFTGQSASNFNVTTNNAVVVSAGTTEVIGPFLKGWFSDTNNKVQVTYSGISSLTVAIIQTPSTTDAL